MSAYDIKILHARRKPERETTRQREGRTFTQTYGHTKTLYTHAEILFTHTPEG